MPTMTLLQIAALYIALNAIITLALMINVGRARGAAKVTLGDGGNPELQRAIRAHGNNTEYVPLALILLLTLALLQASVLILHVVGGALTVGRIAHGIGLATSGGMSVGRGLGMILTIISIVTAIVVLLMKVLA